MWLQSRNPHIIDSRSEERSRNEHGLGWSDDGETANVESVHKDRTAVARSKVARHDKSVGRLARDGQHGPSHCWRYDGAARRRSVDPIRQTFPKFNRGLNIFKWFNGKIHFTYLLTHVLVNSNE